MIAKAKTPADAETKPRKRRTREAVDVELTVRFNFGDDAEDRVTVLDGRRVPMVGSVLANRDRIIRGFMRLLLRTAAQQPRVARELFPWLKRKPRQKSRSRQTA